MLLVSVTDTVPMALASPWKVKGTVIVNLLPICLDGSLSYQVVAGFSSSKVCAVPERLLPGVGVKVNLADCNDLGVE